MVLNFISLKMLKMLKPSPNPKRERTQLKMDLFAEGTVFTYIELLRSIFL